MKKLVFGVLAVVAVFSLVACGQKEEIDVVAPVIKVDGPVTNIAKPVEEEQVGVGNTDEGMVVLVLEQHYKGEFPDVVEEVIPTRIKVYSEDEIANDPPLSDYTINEGDIVFDADYDLKIVEGYEDMMSFTAGTGEIDGQWIRNKSNVGIARSGENGYTLDAFGTAF